MWDLLGSPMSCIWIQMRIWIITTSKACFLHIPKCEICSCGVGTDLKVPKCEFSFIVFSDLWRIQKVFIESSLKCTHLSAGLLLGQQTSRVITLLKIFVILPKCEMIWLFSLLSFTLFFAFITLLFKLLFHCSSDIYQTYYYQGNAKNIKLEQFHPCHLEILCSFLGGECRLLAIIKHSRTTFHLFISSHSSWSGSNGSRTTETSHHSPPTPRGPSNDPVHDDR